MITDTVAGARWSDTAISEIKVARDEMPAATPPPPAQATAAKMPPTATVNEPSAPESTPPNVARVSAEDHSALEEGVEEMMASGRLAPWLAVLALAGAFAFMLTLWTRRKDRRSEHQWLKRATAADRSIEKEVKALGRTYEHVAIASHRLCERAERSVSQLATLRGALRRAGRLAAPQVDEQRLRLKREAQSAFARLRTIVERLEQAALQLTAKRAGDGVPGDVDGLLTALHREIDIAIAADDEAKQIISAECGTIQLASGPRAKRGLAWDGHA